MVKQSPATLGSLNARARVRVFLAMHEDASDTPSSLQNRIAGTPTLTVCGAADTENTALEQIQATQPDVAVVDLGLKEGSGFHLIQRLHTHCRKVKILACAMLTDVRYIDRSLRAGAHGYVCKTENPNAIITAIGQLMQRKAYLSPSLQQRILDLRFSEERPVIDCLSHREFQVLDLIGKGWTIPRIAQHLALSAKTVETHRQRIRAKLRLPNAQKLRQFAAQWTQQAA